MGYVFNRPWSLKLTSSKWKLIAWCCCIAGFHGSLSKILSAGKQRQSPAYEWLWVPRFAALRALLLVLTGNQALPIRVWRPYLCWLHLNPFPFLLTGTSLMVQTVACGKTQEVSTVDTSIWKKFCLYFSWFSRCFVLSTMPSEGDSREDYAVHIVEGLTQFQLPVVNSLM